MRSFMRAAKSFNARAKSTARRSIKPSAFKVSVAAVAPVDPDRAERVFSAVMVGLILKSTLDPGVALGIERILRPVSAWRAVTDL